MAHTYEELKKKKVAELREIAKGLEHEAVKGYTQLNKDHLLKALCKASTSRRSRRASTNSRRNATRSSPPPTAAACARCFARFTA